MLKLANLARIKISEDEAESLSHEFESILKYVGEVKSIKADIGAKSPEDFPVRNVLRKDGEGHESGIHSEALLASAPERKGDYIKVKKIL